MSRFLSTANVTTLKERARLLREIRQFFDERDFFEVQTPVLSHDVLIDRYIDPIAVPLGRETLYLQTSPEFALKRLLASGCERIYEITPAFRSGDRGPKHNVEFSILEYYRVGDGYDEGIALLGELAEVTLKRGETRCRSFRSVFEEATGLDPHNASIESLREVADRIAPDYPASFLMSPQPATTDDWIDYLFSERVQPTLGFDSPVILFDYPVTGSQLAKVGPPREPEFEGAREVTRRFELFADGLELANGYDELTDPNVLRSRFAETTLFRQAGGRPDLPTESRLLSAMDAGLPPSSGCALGIDRLLMVRLGLASIDEVIPFPIEFA